MKGILVIILLNMIKLVKIFLYLKIKINGFFCCLYSTSMSTCVISFYLSFILQNSKRLNKYNFSFISNFEFTRYIIGLDICSI